MTRIQTIDQIQIKNRMTVMETGDPSCRDQQDTGTCLSHQIPSNHQPWGRSCLSLSKGEVIQTRA